MKKVYRSLPSLFRRSQPKLNIDEEKEVLFVGTEQEDGEKDIETRLKGQSLAKQLFEEKESRRPEVLRELSENLELAEEMLKVYVTHFNFESLSMSSALHAFLEVLWPEDELELQHLFIAHFSEQFLKANKMSPDFQTPAYYLSWAIIILNADLHGGNKGRKMTCKEFIGNLIDVSRTCRCQYPRKDLEFIYRKIKAVPLNAFAVRTRSQNEAECDSTLKAEDDTTRRVHKRGDLICKKVMDKNGIKTRTPQRAWKPYTAVLKGMVLHLENDLYEPDSKIIIGLHHAVAYPLNYKKRPHVLCLRTADSSVFYLQTGSEAEQASWVTTINRIAARYSAPHLYAVSQDTKQHHPWVLPSFPTKLSLQQQLEYYKHWLQKVLELMDFSCTLSGKNDIIWDRMVQELTRYQTYVSTLQELVAADDHHEDDDAGEGCSYSNLPQ
ncbi:PH and SEC7 domain-containing protein 1-like [Clarias gariepinus]|uniref:PH and SEC7 domain-containing protein 1-like n=1 Tax=Clarias gariepinus TaxID=13013 RepID=UPI00234DD9F1|nr:PH and SEC7 domain-containing protein 1-like [Clarias gariepinus]